MLSKEHPIILLIDRFGFSLFQDTLTSVLKFNFIPDIVANLDVVNKEQFLNLIAAFIVLNKIVPSSLVIVLSDAVIYAKDLPNHPQADLPNQSQSPAIQEGIEKGYKEEIQNFLENIPFEEVLAKVIKTVQLRRVVAVNKDLVMTIANAFINKGSVIEAIVPSFMYGSNNFAQGLTQNNAQAVLGGAEILRLGNLLTDQQIINAKPGFEIEQKKKPRNFRQYILVGVFVMLLVVLAVVYFLSTISGKEEKASAVNEITSSPTVVPELEVSPSPTIIDLKSVKIKIVQSSESDEAVNNLKNALTKIGFEDIVSESAGNTIPEKSSVLFSKNIPEDVRNIAIAEIKKDFPDISFLETEDSNSTITILMGQLQNQ